MSENKDKGSYNLMLGKIVNIYNEGMQGVSIEDRNKRILGMYWSIGKNITKIERDKEAMSQFGNKLLSRITQDLTSRLGKGFSRRNIFYFKKFFNEYDRVHVSALLTWTHYRTLLSVEAGKFRKKLELFAIENKLSNPELASLVKAGDPDAEIKNIQNRNKLIPRKGSFDLYKVVATKENGKNKLELDCGFNVLTDIKKISARKFKAGQYLKSIQTEKGSVLTRIQCKPGERYCYRGHVQKVVDGDTLLVKISVGFGNNMLQRLRLRGVYAAELGTDGGERAKKFVIKRVDDGKSVKILTYGIDMYGRYVADVFYGKRENFLNREMVSIIKRWKNEVSKTSEIC